MSIKLQLEQIYMTLINFSKVLNFIFVTLETQRNSRQNTGIGSNKMTEDHSIQIFQSKRFCKTTCSMLTFYAFFKYDFT